MGQSPSKSPWILDVKSKNFQEEVVERSRQTPVIVDFWAPWCQPCRMLGPMLEQLADEYAGKFYLAPVDIDTETSLAREFQVQSIPLVVGFVDGQPASHFLGVLPESQIRSFLDRLCPSEAQQLVKEARSLESADPPAAAQKYREALDREPRNDVALAGLAEMTLLQGQWADAGQLAGRVGEGTTGYARAQNVLARLTFHEAAEHAGTVEACQARVESHPSDLRARLDLGLVLAANGRFEESLDQLVQIVEADRTFGSEHAKAPMVQIFAILGPQHPASMTYRSRLASALY